MLRLRYYNRDKRGFTLIEVVVALAIAAIAFPTLLKAFSAGIKSYSLVESKTTAYYLLRLKMGQVEMTGYPDTGKTDGDFGNDSRYKWATEVTETDTDSLREVTVVITWQERGQDKSLQLSTYMADRTIEQQDQQDQQGGTAG
jgi:general secretion pathway protein I